MERFVVPGAGSAQTDSKARRIQFERRCWSSFSPSDPCRAPSVSENGISYTPSDEDDSDDCEGENQELAQIDKERRRNCILTPLATNQLQNQENQCCKVHAFFNPILDRHSSEEELERISREFAAEKRKWSQVSRLSCHSDNTSSSDEEGKHLCGMSVRSVEQAEGLCNSSSPVLFSASPPKRLQSLARNPSTCPIIFTSVGSGFDQGMPCKRYRQGYKDKISRPSLDLEKMQQKMLLKKNCGSKTRVIKIRDPHDSTSPPSAAKSVSTSNKDALHRLFSSTLF